MIVRSLLSSSLALVLGAGLSSTATAEVPTEAIERFLAAGHAVVAELGGETPNALAIVDSINAMLEDAKPVAVAFGEKYTQCAPQLARMIELYPQIDVWTATEIRRNIEVGQSLPPAEGCYAARDVVAHPAIVRALTRLGIQPSQQARLVREMNEAIEHMEEIAEDLGQD